MISVSFSALSVSRRLKDADLNAVRPKSVGEGMILTALKVKHGTYDREMNRLAKEYEAARRSKKPAK